MLKQPIYAASSPPPRSVQRGNLTAHRKPLPALTGIRFVAAFYVVLYHSRLPALFRAHHAALLANLVENGAVAVMLFFLLSGFILSYTYQGQIGTRRDFRRFYEARFARIWPLYTASLLLSTVVNHTTPPPATAAAVLLMVQGWNPWNGAMAGAWNFVCWTLSTEALFYIVFPMLQRSLERSPLRVLGQATAVMMLLSIAVGSGLCVFNAYRWEWTHIPLAVIRIPEFIIGMCMGTLFNREVTQRSGVGHLLPTPVGLWTMLAALISVGLLCLSSSWLTAACVVSFAAMLYGLAAERSPLERLLSSRALVLGGKISFGVYLLQWPVKTFVNRVCDRIRLTSTGMRFGIDVILLLLASTVAYFWLEEPARRVIRSGFAKLESRHAIKLSST